MCTKSVFRFLAERSQQLSDVFVIQWIRVFAVGIYSREWNVQVEQNKGSQGHRGQLLG